MINIKEKFSVLVIFALLVSVSAADASSREKRITQELKCIADHLRSQDDFSWSDVCYTVDQDRYRQQNRSSEVMKALDREESGREMRTATKKRTSSRVDDSPYVVVFGDRVNPRERSNPTALSDTKISLPEKEYRASKPQPKRYREPLKRFDIGWETFHHKYKEPSVGVEQDGFFNGIHASYTQRVNLRRKTLGEHLDGQGDALTMFKADGTIAWGQADFDGTNVGRFDDRDNFFFDVRGMAGYDFVLANNYRFTPYGGIGFKYWEDASPGRDLDIGSFGAFPFDRHTRYLYLPFGVDAHSDLKDGWFLDLNMEYDVLLTGQVKNNYEGAGEQVIEADTLNLWGLDDKDYKLDAGYGLRTAVKLTRQRESFNIFFEPFYRYWKINGSEIEQFTSNSGHIVWVTSADSTPIVYSQPPNETHEFGIRAGVQF